MAYRLAGMINSINLKRHHDIFYAINAFEPIPLRGKSFNFQTVFYVCIFAKFLFYLK